MNVRLKLAIAYVVAAAVFVASAGFLLQREAHGGFFVVAGCLVAVGFLLYVTGLKCPHCHAKAFSTRWLAMLVIPRTCANCDRDFAED
jgi:hypothetical protein